MIYKIIAVCCVLFLSLIISKIVEQLFFSYHSFELSDEEELQCGDKVFNLLTGELCIFLCMDDTNEDLCIVIDDMDTDYIHIGKTFIYNIRLVR